MIQINDLSLNNYWSNISDLSIHVNKGEVYVLLSSERSFSNQICNIFSGLIQRFKGEVLIDGEDIRVSEDSRQDSFVLIDIINDFPPDIRINDYLIFIAGILDISEEELEEFYLKSDTERIRFEKFADLAEVDRRKLILATARFKKSKNLIFNNFVAGMPLKFMHSFKNWVGELKTEGCTILYLSDDIFYAPEIGDRIGFLKKGKLLQELTSGQMKKVPLAELYYRYLAPE